MIVFVIFILLSICFCIVVRKGSQIPPAHKTEKIANAINNVLLISPIIATQNLGGIGYNYGDREAVSYPHLTLPNILLV